MDTGMTNGHTHDEFRSVFALLQAIGKSLIANGSIQQKQILDELENINKNSQSDITKSYVSDIADTVRNW